MQLIKTDGTTEVYEDSSLEGMQKAVGGYIQAIPTKDGKLMILNEEGKFMNLPPNETANALVDLFPGDYIVGDVLIIDDDEME
jgi:hypothetical protein